MTLTPTRSAQAFLVTYTYMGSQYTLTNAPNEPGFTLSDFVVATVVIDSSTWGTTVDSGLGTISSGPWQVGADAFSVTTDIAGNIIAWNLSGALPGLDITTGGSLDGSGLDNIFGDRPSGGVFVDNASVQYPAGARSAGGNGWTMLAVPEPSSLFLFLLGLGAILLVVRATRVEQLRC